MITATLIGGTSPQKVQIVISATPVGADWVLTGQSGGYVWEVPGGVGVGAINESDILLASTSNAIVIGFNVRPNELAQAAAKRDKVDMRMYRVIYDAINEITDAMKGMLAPKFREAIIGHAEVRQTYKVSAIGTIAGCYVKDGKITRDASVRVLRDNIVIHEGKLGSLQRFKDAVKEVAAGYECGMSIEKFNDIKEGDIFECFVMEQIKE